MHRSTVPPTIPGAGRTRTGKGPGKKIKKITATTGLAKMSKKWNRSIKKILIPLILKKNPHCLSLIRIKFHIFASKTPTFPPNQAASAPKPTPHPPSTVDNCHYYGVSFGSENGHIFLENPGGVKKEKKRQPV